MPIYEYRCDECGASFEAFQKMSDDPLATCEKCGGPLRKVLHPVAIHFKGSGFYTTDYGKGSRHGAPAAGTARGRGASTKYRRAEQGDDLRTRRDGESSESRRSRPRASGKAKEKQKAT